MGGLLLLVAVPLCWQVISTTVRLLLHPGDNTWRRYRGAVLILVVVNVAVLVLSPRLWLWR